MSSGGREDSEVVGQRHDLLGAVKVLALTLNDMGATGMSGVEKRRDPT